MRWSLARVVMAECQSSRRSEGETAVGDVRLHSLHTTCKKKRILTRHGRILEDAPLQELHDVERSPDHGGILTETVRLGHGDIGRAEGLDDAVLTLDLVGRLREQLSWRLFPEDVALARRLGGEQVGWVGLAVAELLDVERHGDFGDVGLEVALEGGHVDGLADTACHGGYNDQCECTRGQLLGRIIKKESSER